MFVHLFESSASAAQLEQAAQTRILCTCAALERAIQAQGTRLIYRHTDGRTYPQQSVHDVDLSSLNSSDMASTRAEEEVFSPDRISASIVRASDPQAVATQLQNILFRLITLKVSVLWQRYTKLRILRKQSIFRMQQSRRYRRDRRAFLEWLALAAYSRRLRALQERPLYDDLLGVTCEMTLDMQAELSTRKHELQFKEDVRADLQRSIRSGHKDDLCPEIRVQQVSVTSVTRIQIKYTARSCAEGRLESTIGEIESQIGSRQSVLKQGIRTGTVLRHYPTKFHFRTISLCTYKRLRRAFTGWGGYVERRARHAMLIRGLFHNVQTLEDASRAVALPARERRLLYVARCMQARRMAVHASRAFRAWMQHLVDRNMNDCRRDQLEISS